MQIQYLIIPNQKNTLIKHRGRPKNSSPSVDHGTPELQKQRLKIKKNIPNANAQILGGSVLHYLKVQNLISHNEFLAGIAFGRLYSNVLRSFGIKRKLYSIAQLWGQIKGKETKTFSSYKIEKVWAYFCTSLNSHPNLSTSTLNLAIRLIDDQISIYEKIDKASINLYLYTLKQLLAHWNIVEKSPLKTGYFQPQLWNNQQI